jgi:hypothetical protein
MRKRLTSMLLAGASVVAALTLVASSASAASTWTISPGGSYTASLTSGAKAVFTDTTTGNTVTCTSSSFGGSLQTGSGLSNSLGTITTVTGSSCKGPYGSTGTAMGNVSSSAWGLNGLSYSSGVTTGTITDSSVSTGIGITISLSSILGACSITLTGKSSIAATASVTYTSSTGVLRVTGSPNLIVASSTCPGFNAGDHATFTGSYTVSPKQTITSP